MSTPVFSFGDRLTHATRPEWGVGEVVSAQPHTQEGKACQRLQVRFERAGLKTLSTGVADLRPASGGPAGGVATAEVGPSVEQMPDEEAREHMTALPMRARDPFVPLETRLARTLDLFKYEPSGGSLLDWASVQSGLGDPMTRFNRHELEDLFARFRTRLEAHLADLVGQAKRTRPETIRQALQKAPRAAVDAVRRIDARR